MMKNVLTSIETKNDAQTIAKRMIHTVLHEGAGVSWVKATQSFLGAIILYIREKYKENASLREVLDFLADSVKDNFFLKNVIRHIDSNHPSYHAFNIVALCKETTRSLVFTLSELSVRETLKYLKV